MTVSGTLDARVEGFCARKLTGAPETLWEVKRTAEAGLVSKGKRITRKSRTLTRIAERFWNSVIGFKMDRFSSIGGQVIE